MPSVEAIRSGKALIRDTAARLDPTAAWDKRVSLDTSFDDAATVGATQVVLYLAEQRAPLPAGLHVLLQPATMREWTYAMGKNWDSLVRYIEKTLGAKPFGKPAVIFIAGMAGTAATFILGVRALARWEDRRG